jgi:hypothetical protein
MKRFLLILSALFFWTASVAAQETATLTQISDAPVHVGDPILLTLTVEHSADSHVLFPDLAQAWQDWHVSTPSPATTTDNGDGTATTTQQIDVRLFTTGETNTPPLTLTIVAADGTLRDLIVVPQTLTVTSVLVEGDSELRDIKGQATLPPPFPTPIVAGVTAVSIAAIALAVWFWKRKGRILPDMRQPHERALAGLSAAAPLLASEQWRDFYTQTSDTLRVYLEQRFSIQATERTTDELAINTHLPQRTLLLDLLYEADRVKFADWQPDSATAQRYFENSKRFVELTRPVPAPATPAQVQEAIA